jgi:hypothetical protein
VVLLAQGGKPIFQAPRGLADPRVTEQGCQVCQCLEL